MSFFRAGLRSSLPAVLGLLWSGSLVSNAQPQDVRAVRAALVFNLIKNIEWPADRHQLTVGVIGGQDTAKFLQSMLDGRAFESRVIHVIPLPSEEDAQNCEILYIPESQAKQAQPHLDEWAKAGIVTVGEADSSTRDGGMIGLVTSGDHIQLQVNSRAAQAARIKIGVRLLNAAVIIQPASQSAERKIISRSEPAYPAIAARMSLHGTVRLQVGIAPEGSVKRVLCLGGHPLLAQAAVEAVRSWKYEPAPKESTQIVEVSF